MCHCWRCGPRCQVFGYLPVGPMAELVRQFRDVDTSIRVMDEQERAAAEAEAADADDGGEASPAWDDDAI
jgi:hypothetical protein